jgi:hypothetical protein
MRQLQIHQDLLIRVSPGQKLFHSGGLRFTVGDFIGIFSLIAAATSIAVFLKTVRHKK